MKQGDLLTEPTFELVGDAPQRLVLRGDWVVTALADVDRELRDGPFSTDLMVTELDLSELGGLDTAGAFLIDRTLRTLGGDPALLGASEEAQSLLHQARTLATQEEHAPPVVEEGHGFVDLLERTGRNAEHMWHEALESLSFLGATLVALSTIVWRPAKMRWTALVAVMEEAGLDAVPIIAFLSFFVGMVVAFIGATTLAQFGATIFVVELVGFGVLRELGGVLVAIIIAGRTNSAFTAQIGAMKMRQEIDAMQTLGLNPMHVIVAPRVLAMMIMVPVLTFIGMLTAIAGGMTVGWLILDINPTVFFNRLQDNVPIDQFWIGMSKAPVFGLAIALIGCRQGLEVGGSVQSLGQHTTKSVVQALFAIIVIDAFFALFYQELGI
ncbi:MAG: ABC transporter permease [Hyphomonadaceae bacterium]|nr:ABC transporter permease [Hyphomonadaceae bacterium]